MGRAGTHSPGEGSAGEQPVQIPEQDSAERGGGGGARVQEPVPAARAGGRCAALVPHPSPLNGWVFPPASGFIEI